MKYFYPIGTRWYPNSDAALRSSSVTSVILGKQVSESTQLSG